MPHESSYDQREQEARDEDRRQALQDAGEDDMNERRQLLKPSVAERAMRNVMAVLGIEDEDDRPRSPPDDLTTNETRDE